MTQRLPRAEECIFMIGELTDELTRQIIGQIFERVGQKTTLVILSCGGLSLNGLAIVDVMALHGDVDTFCIGQAHSAAALCLAAGKRRYVTEGSVAMLHEAFGGTGNTTPANAYAAASYLSHVNEMQTRQLERLTGAPNVRECLARDFYIYGGAAIVAYGLADEVVVAGS